MPAARVVVVSILAHAAGVPIFVEKKRKIESFGREAELFCPRACRCCDPLGTRAAAGAGRLRLCLR